MKYDVSVQRTKWNCYNDSKQNNLERKNGQGLKKKKKKIFPFPNHPKQFYLKELLVLVT